ncbi:hypothetical protein ASPBRDRAFT_139605 [Aspergillus brasiliensis CBS 101740]|uniref:N-acetyltransferase domain-containing protein n=1 Tax=Aspergillus brasiliensis (strain CBS 101740 / IMI 381727 / IBT 21946) TaxID=767769 RepID=A0A1L9U1X1_ASPBC|nr:hypothetical protein ASPBRDRAFT_139605 [Aspergillus brasiliensis CBS 101740]
MKVESWRRDGYLVSTDPSLLQVHAINAALGSDMVWWAGQLPADALKRALDGSLCFGLYQEAPSYNTPLKQIGLIRVITDYVTFAYLTDVYILEGHQGAGLGRWLLEIMNEKLQAWPHLRRVMLLTTNKMPLFSNGLGMKDYRELDGMKGVSIAMVEGPGAQH